MLNGDFDIFSVVEDDVFGNYENRIVIEVDASYFDENDKQHWHKFHVHLLNDGGPYDKRISNEIEKRWRKPWAIFNYDEPN